MLVSIAFHGGWPVSLLFAAMYFGVTYVVSRVLWHPLHQAFPGKVNPRGKRHYMVQAWFSEPVFARCTVNVTIANEGIRLSAIPMFRLFFPPLFMPWSELNVSQENPRLAKLSFLGRSLPDLYLACDIETSGTSSPP
ncbi:MAG: hypothetical protein WD066_12380 [Planctomycetaceae bacterium]